MKQNNSRDVLGRNNNIGISRDQAASMMQMQSRSRQPGLMQQTPNIGLKNVPSSQMLGGMHTSQGLNFRQNLNISLQQIQGNPPKKSGSQQRTSAKTSQYQH
jgi:hypothetical protein